MSKYTIKERIFLIKEYFKNSESIVTVQRRWKTVFNVKKAPADNTIRNLVDKFEETGNLADNLSGVVGAKKTIVTPENTAKVQEILEKSPRKSIRRLAQQAGLKKSSTQTIVRKELHLFPYKIQVHHPVDAVAQEKRNEFANEMLEKLEKDEMNFGQIWFTDEAHFYLDGFVNKQNWRIWGTENPHVSVQRSLHPKKTTAWVAISSMGIIGPIFLHDTVTSERYIEILNQFIGIANSLADLNVAWFQQDGARPHRTNSIFELLSEYFGERVIALDYHGATETGIDWPAYSPDLNPCDFYLWGYLKDKVYQTNPKTIEDLEAAIHRETEAISVETLAKVIENFQLRLRHIIAAGGAPFENIVC